MKVKSLILFLLLLGTTQIAKAHAVQIQYCVNCAGDLRIWVEHWHGTENPATTSMNINIDINGTVTSYSSAPGGGVQNVPAGSLPGCSTPLIYGAGCAGNQNTYNDWVYYDFLGLPANQPITVTIVSGNTVFTSDGCGMFPLSFNFIINGVALGTDQYVCSGSATAPISFPPTATWTNSNPAIGLAASGSGSIPSFTPIGPPGTTATINYVNNCGAGDFDIIIQQNPTPTFVIGNGGTGQDTVCFGQAFNFSDASTIPPPNTITNWDWNWGDGSPNGTLQNESHTYAAPGDYVVVLQATSDSGCVAATFGVPVHVAPMPTAAFNSTTVCANTASTLTDASTIAPGTIDQWQWDIGANGSVEYSTQGPINHTFTAGGLYSVELTVTSVLGCSSSIVNDVTVDYTPVPDFTADSVCIGNPSTMVDNSSIAVGAIGSYSWDFGGGNTATGSPTSFTFPNAGNNNVTLTVTGNTAAACAASTTLPVYVRQLPVANFTVADKCFYDNVAPVNTSAITIGTMTYQWNFGDATPVDVNTNPTHLYAVPGTYTISLTATSNFGCTNSIDFPVIAHAQPTAAFSATSECVTFGNAYTDLSTNPNAINGDAINDWDWDVTSNGSVDYTTQNPTHTFPAQGIYNTELTVTTAFGCSHTIQGPVTVYPEPFVNYNVGDFCFGANTAFEELTSISNAITANTVDVFDWDFGDGTTTSGPLVTHVFGSHGNKFVQLTATSNHGCVHDTTIVVNIKPLPTPNFVATSICENTPPTTFGDQSSTLPGYGLINDWLWDFGTGAQSTSQSTTYNYGAAGTYNATLTVTTTDGCVNSLTLPVVVHPKPTALFTAPITQICSPDTINFVDLSTAGSPTGFINQWRWDFYNGGGSIAQNPTAYYSVPGPYPELFGVKLIVRDNNSCYDTIVVQDFIEVDPMPEASFEIDPFELLITDTDAIFTNTSVNSDYYTWRFGDGSPIVSTEDAEHTYPNTEANTYQIEMIAFSQYNAACIDTAWGFIEVKDIIIFHVPNIFTPDGDDYNETWQPVFFSGYDPYDFHLLVFNRFGEIIWESFNASAGWDGTYGNGGLVDDGVYIWTIEFKETMSDKRHKHNGHVTVLK